MDNLSHYSVVETNGLEKAKQRLARAVYNPDQLGIHVIAECIPQETLNALNREIEARQDEFTLKREKVIANNQTVLLVHRGPFESLIELCDTPFAPLIKMYMGLRDALSKDSRPGEFRQGASIEIKIVHYPISELGVDTHRDLSSNINCIVLFNLEGKAMLEGGRAKDNLTHNFFLVPGDVTIMRAPRNKNETDMRPYHKIGRVTEPRTILVIREIDEELELETNAGNWRGF